MCASVNFLPIMMVILKKVGIIFASAKIVVGNGMALIAYMMEYKTRVLVVDEDQRR